MHRDSIRQLIGTLEERRRVVEGYAAALRLLEACWCSMTPAERDKAQQWTGWTTWLYKVELGVEEL